MISLETAKKLKEVGLEWEPKLFDVYAFTYLTNPPLVSCLWDETSLQEAKHPINRDRTVWLPRLDQLLAEIEWRGYWWVLNRGKIIVGKGGIDGERETFYADTSEDAAGKALGWILERERSDADA